MAGKRLRRGIFKGHIHKLIGATALSVFGLAAQAQDIKLGFNGDLSASPSALSGQADVLGLQANVSRAFD